MEAKLVWENDNSIFDDNLYTNKIIPNKFRNNPIGYKFSKELDNAILVLEYKGLLKGNHKITWSQEKDSFIIKLHDTSYGFTGKGLSESRKIPFEDISYLEDVLEYLLDCIRMRIKKYEEKIYFPFGQG